mmetsp:Transcript_9529/g.24173  ORF Transcript_9529/g.24173 Transcript_9529/m.24173 type:complete len:214 (-) Transcript_9529:432-1073(-)
MGPALARRGHQGGQLHRAARPAACVRAGCVCVADRAVRRLLCQRLQARLQGQGLWRQHPRPRRRDGQVRLPDADGGVFVPVVQQHHPGGGDLCGGSDRPGDHHGRAGHDGADYQAGRYCQWRGPAERKRDGSPASPALWRAVRIPMLHATALGPRLRAPWQQWQLGVGTSQTPPLFCTCRCQCCLNRTTHPPSPSSPFSPPRLCAPPRIGRIA